MQILKRSHLHLLLLILFFPASIAQQNLPSFCGKIRIQTPFSLQNLTDSSPLNHMVLCKSQKLYFRTSLGLFHISSIDYATKVLTVSQSSCSSSSSSYVSPSRLSSGFPPPPRPNSLALFDCSSSNNHTYQIKHNCTALHRCNKASNELKTREKAYPCLLVGDLNEKLSKGFHPKDLNCSRYSRVYRINSSVPDELSFEQYELGTRISFDIPDHAPNLCQECEKPQGNCGIGLRCICHPKECKDKVISSSMTMDPFVLRRCLIQHITFLLEHMLPTHLALSTLQLVVGIF